MRTPRMGMPLTRPTYAAVAWSSGPFWAHVDQRADGAQVLVDGRRREFSHFERDAVTLHHGAAERAAARRKMPGEELAQGGAVAAARGLGLQAIAHDRDEHVSSRRPVGAGVQSHRQARHRKGVTGRGK
jgi:hypothetical protein